MNCSLERFNWISKQNHNRGYIWSRFVRIAYVKRIPAGYRMGYRNPFIHHGAEIVATTRGDKTPL